MTNNLMTRIEFEDKKNRNEKEIDKIIWGAIKEAIYATSLVSFKRCENFYIVAYSSERLPILNNQIIKELERDIGISIESIQSYALLKEYFDLCDENKLGKMKEIKINSIIK